MHIFTPTVVLALALFMLVTVVYAFIVKRYRLCLSLIILIGVLLRLHAASDAFLHLWDESFHAVVAKNCIASPLRPTLYAHPALEYDYRDWLANHVWLHKPPLALWVMAGSMRLFGINEFALRLPSVIASTLMIILVYKIGAMVWSIRHGLIASALVATNAYLINLAAGRVPVDHIDTLFITLVTVGAYFVIQPSNTKNTTYNDILIGIIIGLAYLTKSLPGLLIYGLWLISVLLTGQQCKIKYILVRSCIILGVAVCVGAPWAIYSRIHYPLESSWESMYTIRHIFETLEGHSHPWYYYINRINRWLGPISYVALIYACIRTISRQDDLKANMIILAWFCVPHIVFSAVATKMPMYVMIGSGAGFLIVAHFVIEISDIINARLSTKPCHRYILLGIIIVSTCIPLIELPRRLHLIREYDRSPSWADDLRDLSTAHSCTNTVVFAVPNAIAAMFYGDYAAYNYLPTHDVIQEVIADGREVVIFDQGALPTWARQLEGVHIFTPPLRNIREQRPEPY